MKKTALSAKLFMATVTLAAMCSCGSGNADKKGNDSTKNNTSAPASQKVADQGFASNANIRYVDRDSLMNSYKFAKETVEKCQKIAAELQQYQNGLERQMQQKANAIQQKVQSNGYLSEASYNADMQELQKLEQNLHAQYAKRAAADEKKINELTMSVTDAIENFIVRYNKENKYDAILWREVGLYFNPQLDITKDVVEKLNAEYK